MSVATMPRPPETDDLELLIREARARQRRRRLRAALALAALGIVAAAGYGIARGLGGGAGLATRGRGPFAAVSAFAGHGRLAFVSRGRLYVLDGSAGRLVAVTAGGGASAPAFSLDGRWLAYGYHGRVGVARGDGAHPRTLRADAATWLPDGRLLAGRGIYRLRPDGAPTRVATAPADLAAWAPDGSRYAFVVARGGRNGTQLIQVADSPSGPRTTWYRVPQSFAASTGYRSPGIGDVVVLPRRRGLLVWLDPLHSASIATDGLPVYELSAPGARPRRLGITLGARFSVSVAADGRLALGAGSDRIAWRTKHVRSCSASSARCATVAAPRGLLTLEPAWSPDGRTLAFVAARSGAADDYDFSQRALERWYATRHLWLLPAGSARPVELPGTGGAAAPTWSRDGRSLLFVREDALWLLPRLGARPVAVAGPLLPPHAWGSYYGEIRWSGEFAWAS